MPEYKIKTCPVCWGSGKIEKGDQPMDYQCPKCNGKGSIKVYKAKK